MNFVPTNLLNIYNLIWTLIEIPFPKTYRFYQYSDFATFRYTLYLIAPWESSFARIDQVPNYNVQVCFISWYLSLHRPKIFTFFDLFN